MPCPRLSWEGFRIFKIKGLTVLKPGPSTLRVTSLSSPVLCIRTSLQGPSRAPPPPGSSPRHSGLACLSGSWLRPGCPTPHQHGGLFVGRVSGNHDNTGRFLVAVETCGVGTWQSWPGHSMWGLTAHPPGPVSWSGGAPCLPMAKAPVSRGMLILSPWEGGRRAGGA